MEKINKTLVDRAQPADKDAFTWDSEVKGFGLKVAPSGAKSFVFQYRNTHGESRRITIGRFSATLTAEQARTKAKQYRRIVEDGGDPLATKQEARTAMKVDELLDLYLNSQRFTEEKAASTQAVDKGRINRHLRPTLGKKHVKSLTREDVRKAFSAIRDGETAVDEKTGSRGRAIVKGGEGTARSAVRLLRAVFTWAISEGLADNNPAEGVKIGIDGERSTILETAADYERMFRTLDRLENEKRIRTPVADAIRVIALTGARRGEIANLKWRHVDMKGGQILLPPAEHKTGGKTKKPRIIALPAAAQAIITKQPDGGPDDFVFPPAKGGGALSLSKVWRLVRAEAELPPDIGLHGLRHSVATHLAFAGAEAAELMTVLGHRQMSTTQRYIHAANDARAALAERAAALATAAMSGALTADVVSIKGVSHEK